MIMKAVRIHIYNVIANLNLTSSRREWMIIKKCNSRAKEKKDAVKAFLF